MERIFIDHTDDTPEVILDYDKGIFSLSGRSLPENAVDFYLPILEWMNALGEQSLNDITFDFKLDYFNTSSAKQLTKLLLILQKIALDKNVQVNWHYFEDDTDIMQSGARFAKLIDANIKLLPFSEEE